MERVMHYLFYKYLLGISVRGSGYRDNQVSLLSWILYTVGKRRQTRGLITRLVSFPCTLSVGVQGLPF